MVKVSKNTKTNTEASVSLTANANTKVYASVKLFAYLGGIFFFSGILLFILRFWPNMEAPLKIGITLGAGILLYILLGILSVYQKGSSPILIPLILCASFFQTIGLFVIASVYRVEIDFRIVSILIFAGMLIQQCLIFWVVRNVACIFVGAFFCFAIFLSILDIWQLNGVLATFLMGILLLLLSIVLNHYKYKSIASIWVLIGTFFLLAALWGVVRETDFEFIFFVACVLLILISALIKNRALLLIGSIATALYIVYFTAEYFLDSPVWPILLAVIGLISFGISTLILILSKRYLQKNK